MPVPPARRPGAVLRRRTALAVLVGAVATACTPWDDDGGGGPRQATDEPPEVDPDVTVAGAALAAHQAVLGRVRATAQRHPRLAEALAPVVSAHTAHTTLLADAVPAGAADSRGGATPDVRRTVADDPAGAIADLLRAEQELVLTTKRHAFAARSGAFARVLGSMAASVAQHVVVLEGLPARGGGPR